MIEALDVIHCDVTTTYFTRDGHRHPGRCETFFPARGGPDRSWAAAKHRGWTLDDGTSIDGTTRHRCPLHAREHTTGATQLWWDLRARARTPKAGARGGAT